MAAKQMIASLPRGKWYGSYGVACCPAHDDRTPSLSIRDAEGGKVLVRCHASCDQERVIYALRSRGLWPGKVTQPSKRSKPRQTAASRQARDDANRTAAARAVWDKTIPATGSLVEPYLASRSLHLPIPQIIRFHERLRHPFDGTWPAMVALVTRGHDDKPLAIHRTFLAKDGSGKAHVDPQKMMLGPCRGGAVRLAAAGEVLMVGEGIETCLAAMQARGLPAWAALSTSGLRALDLPSVVREVIVLADSDDAGERAAQKAARRWKREGRRVRIAHPPQGLDFNDMLLGRASNVEGVGNDR